MYLLFYSLYIFFTINFADSWRFNRIWLMNHLLVIVERSYSLSNMMTLLRIIKISSYKRLCSAATDRLCIRQKEWLKKKNRGSNIYGKLQKLRLKRRSLTFSTVEFCESSANKITERIGNKIKNALVFIRS